MSCCKGLRHPRIQRTLLSISLVVCPLGWAWADDWPQWGGPERTSVSKETGLLTSWPASGPKRLWTFRDAGFGYAGMAVVGDRLYTMGAKGKTEYVYVLDLKMRERLWSVEVGARGKIGPCSTPTIDGNFLYTIGSHGTLVCVETASGRKVWSQELQTLSGVKLALHGYVESPLVDGDQVVVTPGGKQGALAAFDKKTGALKWRSTDLTDEAGYTSMRAVKVGGVQQYVQMTDNAIGVRASDGKLLWKFPFGGSCHTPVKWNDCVYFASTVPSVGCKLAKLVPEGDKCKAEQIYTTKAISHDICGVVLVGEYLYFFSLGRNHGWICQDIKTGNIVWRKPIPQYMGSASVVYADGNLYGYHDKRGDVLLIKATSAGYQEQGKFRIPELTKFSRGGGGYDIYTHPVVANGKLYLRDNDLIFCYDIRKPQ